MYYYIYSHVYMHRRHRAPVQMTYQSQLTERQTDSQTDKSDRQRDRQKGSQTDSGRYGRADLNRVPQGKPLQRVVWRSRSQRGAAGETPAEGGLAQPISTGCQEADGRTYRLYVCIHVCMGVFICVVLCSFAKFMKCIQSETSSLPRGLKGNPIRKTHQQNTELDKGKGTFHD